MQQYDEQIQARYQEGLRNCCNDQYSFALEKFNYVKQMVPNFPYIDQNIAQCKNMESAYNNYLKVIELMNQQHWEEALFFLDYIETRLQPNYKNTQQLMQDCRRNIWLLHLQQQNEALFFESIRLNQLNERMTHINQIYDSLMRAHQAQPKAKLDQNQDSYFQERSTGRIDILTLYYCCKRDSKCLNSEKDNPFNHAVCNTIAQFRCDGTISCQGGCETYNIADAYFSCVTHKVGKRQPQQNQDNFEFISSLSEFADFVENCLQRNKLTEAEQQNFRLKLPTKQFLIQWMMK